MIFWFSFFSPWFFLLLFLLLCSDVITKTSTFHRHKTSRKFQTNFSGVTRFSNIRNSYNLERLRSFQRLQSPFLDSVCKLMSFSFPVATYANFQRRNIIINVLPYPYLFHASIPNVISPFLATACHHRRLTPEASQLFVKTLGKQLRYREEPCCKSHELH